MTAIIPLMKQVFRYGLLFVVRAITSFLDFLYPKDDFTIILGSDATNRMSGDPKALFEEIRKNHPEYSVFYITKNPVLPGQIRPNTLSSLLIFLRARFCFTSHGISDFGHFKWSRRKIVIATGHGITFKACGYIRKNRTKLMKHDMELYYNSVTAAIFPSRYVAAIYCLMFGLGGRTYITGHPRNDRLVKLESNEKVYLRTIYPTLSSKDKILLYAPTFRSQVVQTSSTSSMFFPNQRMIHTPVKIFPFDDFNLETFYDFLKTNNLVVLLRLHIGDIATDPRIINLEKYQDRIKWFSYDVCPDVNSILGEVDFLVTDYSSIFYDFLLLNRPIIFVPYDLKEYIRNRGLVVDNYDLSTPGPKIRTMKEFEDYLSLCITGKQDPYSERRCCLNKIIHAHQTNDSTSRIIELMKFLRRNRT